MQSNTILAPMKVIGIGLNKTGTKTLSEALKVLGFADTPSLDRKNSPEIRWELTKHWKANNVEPILEFSTDFNNLEDWPWPLVYKELADKYVDAKFILTMRKSPEVWFNSLCKHAKTVPDNKFEKLIYGYHMPHDFKEQHIQFYEQHNQSVKDYFHTFAPDRLLVLCFEEGDSWDKLCKFLEKEIPKIPFPHRNKRKDIEQISNPHLIKIVRLYRKLKRATRS